MDDTISQNEQGYREAVATLGALRSMAESYEHIGLEFGVSSGAGVEALKKEAETLGKVATSMVGLIDRTSRLIDWAWASFEAADAAAAASNGEVGR